MKQLFPLNLYWPQARLYPALIAIVPLFALVLTLVPWSNLHLSQFIAGLGISVIIYALSEFSRKNGKKLEQGVDDIGPRHTSTMLWHCDTRLHPDRKDPIVEYAASKLKLKRPTLHEENADPAKADVFYERVAEYLRDNTRLPKYPILFNEVVSYGFWRNLYGLKPFGLTANAFTVIVAAAFAYYRYRTNPAYDPTPLILVVAVAAAHAFVLLTMVNREAVVEASNTYARQLQVSVGALMTGEPEKKAPSTKKKT
jgi:4-amino-4-deoxy-L-arabinose transferase-like glycosyltransferase